MRVNKRLIDRAVTIASAVAAPVLSILTRHHAITPADAVDIGTTLTAVVAAYHGGAAVQKRRTDGVPVNADDLTRAVLDVRGRVAALEQGTGPRSTPSDPPPPFGGPAHRPPTGV